MSQLKIPAELKKITPYIRRAEELDKDKTSPESRLVAYYCRQYAVRIGIPLASASAGAKTCLGELLGALEAEKPAMDNFTLGEAAYLCKAFAERIFDKADQEDRAGAATKDTAKVFYAAGTFLQILEQFADEHQGEDAAEIKKKIFYAKWKATDIMKAIKEGREPTAGGYTGQSMDEEGEEIGQENTDGEGALHPTQKATNAADPPDAPLSSEQHPVVETVDNDDDNGFLPPPPTRPSPRPSAPMMPPQMDSQEDEGTEVQLGPPPAYPAGAPAKPFVVLPPPEEEYEPPAPPSIPLPPPAPPMSFPAPPQAPPVDPPPPRSSGFLGFGKKKHGKATKAQIADCTELTKFALAALDDKDTELAASRLKQALQALGY